MIPVFNLNNYEVKMKKQILSILITASFFLTSSLNAHPGRLREDKGHCDHEIGRAHV
jgi:hypothetical protein